MDDDTSALRPPASSLSSASAPSPPGAALQDDRRCFACGPDNPQGLRLQFAYGEQSAQARFMPASRFAGWSGMLHGGIVVTVLDEAMAHAAIAAGVRAVTGRLDVRFRRAVPVDIPLVVRGSVEHRRGRLLQLRASLEDERGTLYALAHGKFIADDDPRR